MPRNTMCLSAATVFLNNRFCFLGNFSISTIRLVNGNSWKNKGTLAYADNVLGQ